MSTIKCILVTIFTACLLVSCVRPAPTLRPSPEEQTSPGVSENEKATPTLSQEADEPEPTTTITRVVPALPSLEIENTLTLAPTSLPSWCPPPLLLPQETKKFRLIYVADQNLWLLEEGEEAIQIAGDSNVSSADLSDDGLLIAYTLQITENTQELWIYDLEAQETYLLLNVDQFKALRKESDVISVVPYGLTWVPGTHRLAFNTYPYIIGDGIWIYIADDIWLIDAEKGSNPILYPYKGHFTFSPNGMQLAIYDPTRISLANTDGTKYRPNVLEAYQAVGLGESYYYPYPFWAPDSQAFIIFISPSENIYDPDTLTQIWEVPADPPQPRMLGMTQAFPPSIVVSPDQELFAYWRWPDVQTSDHELHISTIDGSEDVLYFEDKLVEYLAWSTDSQQFLYLSQASRRPYLGNICGEPQSLSNPPAHAIYAKWVDSSRYFYLNGNNDLQVLHLMSGDERQVIDESKRGDLTFDFALLP